MRIIKYFLGLPLALTLVLAGCSDSDDYQAAAPLQAGNQQVHFSAENKAKTVLLPDAQTKQVGLTVVRTTTSGTTTIPVTLSDATPGITADQQVTFADGDSTATVHVALPDTAKAGDSYAYTLTVSGENTDPYTLLSGGLSFSGTAVIAKTVKILCCIYYSDGESYTNTWYENAYDLGDGLYDFYNFGNSGHAVYLQTDAAKGQATPYVQDGTDIDQYTDEYGTEIGLGYYLYPWGEDKARIGNVYILSNPGYSGFYTSDNSGWFYLSMWQLSTDASPDYWGKFYFWLDE